ncbi:MAG: tyrosine--tRNA ligase [Phycisphaerae bacterium]|nr:tyrosine--tRNA ligase [Phycisphaerae bacterium]
MDFLNELRWRGLLNQCTDEAALREHLESGTRRAYIGYDPTADSLTIGNLVTIMMLVHFARAGHEPVVVMGGATGLIGDPSGKTAERQLRTREEVAQNVERQKVIFQNVFGNAGLKTPTIVNNDDWWSGMSYVETLRDVGKHFSVNVMIQKDSVKSRLEQREQGISYTEFSYMILQAYDFLRLYEDRGVTVQMGGSDQWGNIVGGGDLIRRASGNSEASDNDSTDRSTFGLTCPLVTKADGTKFGKSESGAIWCTGPDDTDSPHRTSPYALYQFWLNTPDADALRFLRIFTLLPMEEIDSIEAAHAENPAQREAQRRLAQESTRLLHGREAMEQAEAAGKALFSGDLSGLDERTLREVFAQAPSTDHDRSSLDNDGADPVDLLIETGLAKSKREAREFVSAGSVSVNGRKLAEGDRVTTDDLLHGSMIAIRRGKKNWHLTRWA